MRSRIIVSILTLVSLFYLVLIGIRGIGLIAEGGIRNIAFGFAVLLIPIIAGGLIVREIRFGYDTVKLGRALSEEDGIPLDTVDRDEFGRVDKAAADIEWQRRKLLVDQSPDDWRAWFLLAVAYDNARDRKQARTAARQAIALFKRR